jgi:hypothetical protein
MCLWLLEKPFLYVIFLNRAFVALHKRRLKFMRLQTLIWNKKKAQNPTRSVSPNATVTFICYWITFYVSISLTKNVMLFLHCGIFSLTPNFQTGERHTICSPWLLAATHLIWRPCTASTTWGRAVLWWQGTHLMRISKIIAVNKSLNIIINRSVFIDCI